MNESLHLWFFPLSRYNFDSFSFLTGISMGKFDNLWVTTPRQSLNFLLINAKNKNSDYSIKKQNSDAKSI